MALITAAVKARQPFFDPAHESAVRLLNGFSEGLPTLTLDVYQRCLLVSDHSSGGNTELCEAAIALVREQLPWISAGVVKTRDGTPQASRGKIAFGTEIPKRVRENGIWYALALSESRDPSLYLDTRNLRAWAKDSLKNKRVLNTFAYTGSLSVAARAASARQVISTDQNRHFLATAETSFSLNNFSVKPKDFITGDFFDLVARLKREQALFDCVFVDPPFFAKNDKGTVDLQSGMKSLINKVRPLVGHDGYLVLVNNAVFVSGADYQALLDELCESEYLSFHARIAVPEDCRGINRVGVLTSDPAPFNHSTKIAILHLTRKDDRRAT